MGPSPAAAEPEVKYPIVFSSIADLEALGLSQQWPMVYETGVQNETLPKPGLPIGCYLYAGGATRSLISISQEFLARYEAKGFSRESLCMGLASSMKFDPETGQRLPTYIYRDDKKIEAFLTGIQAEISSGKSVDYYVPDHFPTLAALSAGIEALLRREFSKLSESQIDSIMASADIVFSDELPLKVPDCFKNGTPYLDCNWKYGLLTGKKLSAAAPQKYREVGETLDRHMQELVKYKTWKTTDISPYLQKRVWGLQMDQELDNPVSTWNYSPTVGLPLGETMGVFNGVREVNDGKPFEFKVENGLHHWAEEVTWFDVSPSFPRGYGYNLTAIDEGFGDGGVSAEEMLMAYDGVRSSGRFSAARLQQLLK